MNLRSKLLVSFVTFFVLFLLSPGSVQAAQSSGPLNILLTNDDGYNKPGIQAMREALINAGHTVTVVAPLTNQSGVGTNLTFGGFVEVLEQEPGVWSVAGTPSDSVFAGLSAILGGNPPDLIISGANFGQNLGQQMSSFSGTVGAGIVGLYKGIPTIAVSVGLLLSEITETPIPFPSTFAAFPLAADFMVRLIEDLQRTAHGGRLLPKGVILSINFPVPYEDIKGVKVTPLDQSMGFDIMYLDVNGVLPSGGGLLKVAPLPLTGVELDPDADINTYNEGYISIAILDGNWTAATSVFHSLKHRLLKVDPY